MKSPSTHSNVYDQPKHDLGYHLCRLRFAWMKIRGISMLLQDFRQDAGTPLDANEAWLGVGLVLEECAKTIRRATRKIEEIEIMQVKSSIPKAKDSQ